MDKRFTFNKKEFLNNDEVSSDASISAYFAFYKEEQNRANYSATLTMRDCYKKVEFEIGLEDSPSSDSYLNTIYKIDKLLSVLGEFREHLIVVKQERDIRNKSWEEEEKKRKEEKKEEKTEGGDDK